MSLDPNDPLDLHPATAAIAEAGDARRRLGVLERRQFEPEIWKLLAEDLVGIIPPALLTPEPSRQVGAVFQPPFGTGWAAVGGFIVSFYKTVEGLVILEGEASGAGAGVGQYTIFTLPAGYRPPVTRRFPNRVFLAGSGVTGRVVVNTDGTVTSDGAAGGSTAAYLEGLVFRV